MNNSRQRFMVLVLPYFMDHNSYTAIYIFLVGVVQLVCNQAVEHNLAAFVVLSLAVRWQGRLMN